MSWRKMVAFVIYLIFFWASNFEASSATSEKEAATKSKNSVKALSQATKSPRAAREEGTCPKRDLAQKVCRLVTPQLSVLISERKISITTMVAKHLFSNSFVKDSAEWHQVRLEQIQGRWVLNFEVWEEPKGDPPVSALKWIALEIEENKLRPITEQTVQSRRLKSLTAAERKKAQFPKEENREYLSDKKELHSLTPSASGWTWQVGSAKDYVNPAWVTAGAAPKASPDARTHEGSASPEESSGNNAQDHHPPGSQPHPGKETHP